MDKKLSETLVGFDKYMSGVRLTGTYDYDDISRFHLSFFLAKFKSAGTSVDSRVFRYTYSKDDELINGIVSYVADLYDNRKHKHMILGDTDAIYYGDDVFIIIEKRDESYRTSVFGVQSQIDVIQTSKLNGKKDKSKVAHRINWYFSDSRGGTSNITFDMNEDNSADDSFYPYLPGGVEDFYKRFDEHRASILLLVGEPGTGKCFAKGTKVLMYDGSIKNVEDIQNGELVMGNDSTPRTVYGTTSGKEEMFEIKPTKGNSFVVNRSHILSVKYNGKVVNLSVDEYLKKNNTFKDRAKLYRTGIDFTESAVSLDPYYLGLWLGDGETASCRIANTDTEVIKYLDSYAKSIGYVLVNNSKNEDKCPIWNITLGKGQHLYGHIINDALQNLGILGNKRIPKEFLVNSRKVRLDVLAGLIDSDGSYSCGGFDIIQKSKELSEDILYLCRSLGFAAYITPCEKADQNGTTGQYYRIFISGDCSVIPTKVKRKVSKPRIQVKNVLHTGFSVKSVGEGEYYGFAVDGNHLFCLNDFTVVHNTTMVRSYLKHRGGNSMFTFDERVMQSDEFFINFMQSDRMNVMVIEDADVILGSRENDGNKIMAKFLNVSEGLIKFNKKKIIFTTNQHPNDIDEALIRPGRCFDVINFRRLDLAEANKVCKKFKLDPLTEDKPYTIAEIFNRNEFTSRAVEKVGFINK